MRFETRDVRMSVMTALHRLGQKVFGCVLVYLSCLSPFFAGAVEVAPDSGGDLRIQPYNFTYNGNLIGVSVDVVRALLAEAGMGNAPIEHPGRGHIRWPKRGRMS